MTEGKAALAIFYSALASPERNLLDLMALNTKRSFSMNTRISPYSVAPLFLNRWSPRAMSGESLDDATLMTLFEAARWAPSSYNGQPWRFVYAKRGTASWKLFFDLMVPFNQSWAKNAAALVIVCSRVTFELNNKQSRTHSFDTGAACENLALQGSALGLVVHGMEGFDYEKAAVVVKLPKDHVVEALFAIGKPGKMSDLSVELQEREEPSDRKKLEVFVFEDCFKR
jgi:nitroreductase